MPDLFFKLLSRLRQTKVKSFAKISWPAIGHPWYPEVIFNLYGLYLTPM